MNLKAELETKLTTPIVGEKPIDALVGAMRRCSDTLIALDELWDYLGTEARQLRVLSRMNLFEPECFQQLLALAGDIQGGLDCINDSTDRNNALRALERKLEAWVKAEPTVVWENGVEGLQASVRVLHDERETLRNVIQLYLDGPDEEGDAFSKVLHEATRAAAELRALVFAVAESL
jgi:hypothetical protein